MIESTPQKCPEKPGEPGGEKALAESLAHWIEGRAWRLGIKTITSPQCVAEIREALTAMRQPAEAEHDGSAANQAREWLERELCWREGQDEWIGTGYSGSNGAVWRIVKDKQAFVEALAGALAACALEAEIKGLRVAAGICDAFKVSEYGPYGTGWVSSSHVETVADEIREVIDNLEAALERAAEGKS